MWCRHSNFLLRLTISFTVRLSIGFMINWLFVWFIKCEKMFSLLSQTRETQNIFTSNHLNKHHAAVQTSATEHSGADWLLIFGLLLFRHSELTELFLKYYQNILSFSGNQSVSEPHEHTASAFRLAVLISSCLIFIYEQFERSCRRKWLLPGTADNIQSVCGSLKYVNIYMTVVKLTSNLKLPHVHGSAETHTRRQYLFWWLGRHSRPITARHWCDCCIVQTWSLKRCSCLISLQRLDACEEICENISGQKNKQRQTNKQTNNKHTLMLSAAHRWSVLEFGLLIIRCTLDPSQSHTSSRTKCSELSRTPSFIRAGDPKMAAVWLTAHLTC